MNQRDKFTLEYIIENEVNNYFKQVSFDFESALNDELENLAPYPDWGSDVINYYIAELEYMGYSKEETETIRNSLVTMEDESGLYERVYDDEIPNELEYIFENLFDRNFDEEVKEIKEYVLNSFNYVVQNVLSRHKEKREKAFKDVINHIIERVGDKDGA